MKSNMTFYDRPPIAVDLPPAVSIADDVVHVELGATRFDLSLVTASSLLARLADKLAARARLSK